MKKIILQFAMLLFAAVTAVAQAPQKFNYQGLARTSSGTPLVSTAIGLRLTVHDATATGTTLYQETFTPTTNAYGLFTVAVGTGTVVSGTFASITWASGDKYLQVEIDPAGGTTYTSIGSDQLLSVPYAMYAASSGGGVTGSGTTNYLPKFTGASAIGNSMIFDNGSTVGVNTTTPTNMAKVEISGVGTYSVAPYYQAGLVVDGTTTASASGVYAEGGWRGVYGRNPGTATGVQAIGVHGRCEGGSYTGSGYGVLAEAVGTGPTNYGIYASASGASGTNWAGYFSGNVHITGSISKGSGTFLIDHPLDPENKYLYHSFVESPDMMNVYNGNIVTNANGVATVVLPDYFEALNKDFRYQLTTIGQPAQVWVSTEISGNKFEIKSDKPNVKVSWQVTGVRHDKFADAHRVVPEVEKEPQFKGHYLHAAEWGAPKEKSFDAITTPAATGDNTSAR
jgi:hypothetical protein